MAGYIGANTSSVTNNQNAAERRKKFTFTANTTVLSGLNFLPDKIHIFHNGIRLVKTTDYTEAADGQSVTLVNAAQAGDEIVAVTFDQNPATGGGSSDFVSASTGGTFSDAVTIDSNGATTLTVDRATSNGDIIDIQKDGTSVGNIAVDSNDNIMFGAKTGGGAGFYLHGSGGTDPFVLPMKENALSDDTVTLGDSARRYKDLFLGGGVYLGGTTASNKLEDYEEGTWTPTIGSGTVTATNAWYIKVGKLVTVSCKLDTFSDRTSGNSVAVGGFPFTSKAANHTAQGSMIASYLSGGDYAPYISSNSSTLYFYTQSTSGFYAMLHNNFNASGSTIYLTITYQTQ